MLHPPAAVLQAHVRGDGFGAHVDGAGGRPIEQEDPGHGEGERGQRGSREEDERGGERGLVGREQRVEGGDEANHGADHA